VELYKPSLSAYFDQPHSKLINTGYDIGIICTEILNFDFSSVYQNPDKAAAEDISLMNSFTGDTIKTKLNKGIPAPGYIKTGIAAHACRI